MRLANGKAGAVLLRAMLMAVILVFAGGLHAADAPAASAPVIDNSRVVVWRVQLRKGEAGPYTPENLDTVVMFLKGGRIRSEAPDGRYRLQTRRPGDAVWVPRGAPLRDTPLSDGPVEEVVIALKDAPVQPLVNSSGLPSAFPRPGSRKVLENPRVIVWQYSWSPGRPTPMHFHDKDAVVAFREEGTLQSVTPAGERSVNTYHPGEIRFNSRNRSHSEQLLSGRQSAVMVELKYPQWRRLPFRGSIAAGGATLVLRWSAFSSGAGCLTRAIATVFVLDEASDCPSSVATHAPNGRTVDRTCAASCVSRPGCPVLRESRKKGRIGGGGKYPRGARLAGENFGRQATAGPETAALRSPLAWNNAYSGALATVTNLCGDRP